LLSPSPYEHGEVQDHWSEGRQQRVIGSPEPLDGENLKEGRRERALANEGAAEDDLRGGGDGRVEGAPRRPQREGHEERSGQRARSG